MLISTFIGIAVHNATANMGKSAMMDFAAGVRQDATGLLGTTLLLADLVSADTIGFLPKGVSELTLHTTHI